MPSYSPPSMDYIIDLASRVTLEQGFHLPTVIAIGTRGEFLTIVEFPETAEERQATMFFLGIHIAHETNFGRMQEAYLINEAWLGTNFDTRPSLDPQRVEVLIVYRHDLRKHHSDMVAKEMLRDGSGNLIDLVVKHDTRRDPSGISSESPLMDAFVAGYQQGRSDQMPPTRKQQG